MTWVGFRLVVLVVAGNGLTRLGIDGRLAGVMMVMVAVIFAGLWWLTRDES